MKKQFLLITILTLFISSFVFAQNTNENCPPLYTHSITMNPEIHIVSVEVREPGNYSVPPKFKRDLDSISKLIEYPSIAKRAEVEGMVKLLLTIDSTGNVIKAFVEKGCGAGLDEFSLDRLKREKFYPAKIGNNSVVSQVQVDVLFNLNLIKDEPKYELSEIKYQLRGTLIYGVRTIIYKSDGSAYYSKDNGTEPEKKQTGKINKWLYRKLSDFIISQCFINYEDKYTRNLPSDASTITITVKSDKLNKTIISDTNGNDPIGFWATSNLIQHISEQIKWEEIKE